MGEFMEIIKKSNSIAGNNSAECSTIEYSFINKSIDLCVATIKGRYPQKGYCKNCKVKELIYILEGSGAINLNSQKIEFEQGDAILIDCNEKYYWESPYCKAAITCTPAWNKEQYKCELD